MLLNVLLMFLLSCIPIKLHDKTTIVYKLFKKKIYHVFFLLSRLFYKITHLCKIKFKTVIFGLVLIEVKVI